MPYRSPHGNAPLDAATKEANLRKAFAEHNIPWPSDTTIYWDHAGPKISYGGGLLKIDDLNPEVHIQFRMNAREMLTLGWRFIVLAWKMRGTRLLLPRHRDRPRRR